MLLRRPNQEFFAGVKGKKGQGDRGRGIGSGRGLAPGSSVEDCLTAVIMKYPPKMRKN
jgi:hypothetical protein